MQRSLLTAYNKNTKRPPPPSSISSLFRFDNPRLVKIKKKHLYCNTLKMNSSVHWMNILLKKTQLIPYVITFNGQDRTPVKSLTGRNATGEASAWRKVIYPIARRPDITY